MFCELSEVQKQLYELILSLPDVDNVKYLNSPCPCGSNSPRKDCCEEYIVPYARTVLTGDDAQSLNKEATAKIVGVNKEAYGIEAKGGVGVSNTGVCKGVIDPRAVIWRQNHPDSLACEKCPSCLCLPVISLLGRVASHPQLLQVTLSTSIVLAQY